MKANAPERIWIEPATDLSKLSGHVDKDSVEYVRKDAFIEKVCEWLRDNYLKYPNEDCADTTKFVMDFKKYMEGK